MKTTICGNIILMVLENRPDIIRYGFVLQCYTQKREGQLHIKYLELLKFCPCQTFHSRVCKYGVVKKSWK